MCVMSKVFCCFSMSCTVLLSAKCDADLHVIYSAVKKTFPSGTIKSNYLPKNHSSAELTEYTSYIIHIRAAYSIWRRK